MVVFGSVEVPVFHEILSFELSGLIIANLNAHLMLAHKPDDANPENETD